MQKDLVFFKKEGEEGIALTSSWWSNRFLLLILALC